MDWGSFLISVLCGYICMALARHYGRGPYLACFIGVIFGIFGVIGYGVFVLVFPRRSQPYVDPIVAWQRRVLLEKYDLTEEEMRGMTKDELKERLRNGPPDVNIPPRPDL